MSEALDSLRDKTVPEGLSAPEEVGAGAKGPTPLVTSINSSRVAWMGPGGRGDVAAGRPAPPCFVASLLSEHRGALRRFPSVLWRMGFLSTQLPGDPSPDCFYEPM